MMSIFAAGNTDGDLQMRIYTNNNKKRINHEIFVHHDYRMS
ncbi:MAG TPA: hypothetical protein VN704_08095 [Verrucomicrobiae bacterium]|nr:hypothetical protein [Verrucomicrobiae bacterium]